MKPHAATIWGHTDETCAAEDCDEHPAHRGLCDHHDLAESDRVAEQLMEMETER